MQEHREHPPQFVVYHEPQPDVVGMYPIRFQRLPPAAREGLEKLA